MTRPDPTPDRRVAYFAFDRGDAATRRRVTALQKDGVAVDGFAMRRRDDEAPDWVTADLGLTKDNAYGQRLAAIMRGVARTLEKREVLAAADVMIARNLDMLAIAVMARARAGLKTPLIYECLDIHRLMVRDDLVGRVFRGVERTLLKRTSALWVSSPAFLSEYFEPRQPGDHGAILVENRMAAGSALPQRPDPATGRGDGRPLRLGWFGNLRCARSLAMMERLGDAYPGALEIHLWGYPALGEIPDFEPRVAAHSSIAYHGRYRAPEDLDRIYGDVDLVWAGDFMDEGFNSDWLLPNRLYEGGWFACPPIAPAKTETGRWIAARGVGFAIPDPLEDEFERLLGELIGDRSPISTARAALRALPDETFVEPAGAVAELIENAIRNGAR